MLSTTPSRTPTTPTTSPYRKSPHCLSCERPRKGHPRARCSSAPPNKIEQAADAAEGSLTELTVALEPMVIASRGPHLPSNERGQATDAMGGTLTNFTVPLGSTSSVPLERDDQTKTFIENRRCSSQPADLEEGNGTDGEASRITRWQEDIAAIPVALNKIPASSPIAGPLIPSTSNSNFTSSNFSKAKGKSISANLPASEQNVANLDISSSCTSTRCTRLPSGAMSVERNMFITRLFGEAAATIYIVPKANVEVIVTQATTLKLTTHLIMNDDENDPQALLVLGPNEAGVQTLLQRVEEGRRATQQRRLQVTAIMVRLQNLSWSCRYWSGRYLSWIGRLLNLNFSTWFALRRFYARFLVP